jgi:hypothetical protein
MTFQLEPDLMWEFDQLPKRARVLLANFPYGINILGLPNMYHQCLALGGEDFFIEELSILLHDIKMKERAKDRDAYGF